MNPVEFFFNKFGITVSQIERLLAEALSKGGDYADLYFEYRINNSVSLEEQLVKSASKSVSQGVGVRVNVGEKTGYAYTDEIDYDAIRRAANVAAHIARRGGALRPIAVATAKPSRDLYSVAPISEVSVERKIELVKEADAVARSFDRRIREVQANFLDEYKLIMIATSEGRLVGDVQPLARFGVVCIADADGQLQIGRAGGGGRYSIDYFLNTLTPRKLAEEAARQAIVNLDAVEAPAGTMEVVLGPGWPGILLHEAVGHGLEADFNRKQTSAFSNLVGQQVASELCTVVDDGTLPNRRGSINIDDEGNDSSSTVLIESGILRGYINDRLNAGLMKAALTGNGRRESYRHMPLPRMTNTYMLAGQDDPQDILRSVKRGLYAVQFGGGQVDITSGKFVFTASEAYLIEDGKVTAPVRDATLIGNGPDVLKKVVAVGYDLQLDQGVGVCGKDGQSVPVGVGLPTIKISELTVGGTK
ncbi:MAG: metalloprotease TldD [Acidobacteriota bacterium]|nr:metalloprotease TldD [Blastocatellia bacterium]MDW8413638.1 metalloprotease TldD [Acidobacteriota bacterium]